MAKKKQSKREKKARRASIVHAAAKRGPGRPRKILNKPAPGPKVKGPTAAEQRVAEKQAAADAKKLAREQLAAKIKKKVAKLTELSSTTAGQALALVEAYDESDTKAQALKEQVGGLKGSISSDKQEIRSTARELKSKGAADRAKLGEKLAGLEQDVERREVKLAELVEWRTGERETMKATMAELRKLIRDKARGGLLFEKPNKDERDPAASPTSGGSAPASRNGTGKHAKSSPGDPSTPASSSSPTGNGSSPAGGTSGDGTTRNGVPKVERDAAVGAATR